MSPEHVVLCPELRLRWSGTAENGATLRLQTCDLHLERVSHPVQRRMPASTHVWRISKLWAFSFVVVRWRLAALLSRLLSALAQRSRPRRCQRRCQASESTLRAPF